MTLKRFMLAWCAFFMIWGVVWMILDLQHASYGGAAFQGFCALVQLVFLCYWLRK